MGNSLERFRKNVQLELDIRHWKASDLCRRTGLSSPQLSKYLNGKKNPTLPVIDKIADAFGITTSKLLSDEDSTVAPPILKAKKTLSEEEAVAIAREAAREAVREVALTRTLRTDFNIEFSETIENLQSVKDNPVALAAVRDLLKPFLAKAAKKRGESA